MRSRIHVNEATTGQLAALLGLTEEEAASVARRRPFTSAAELSAALPPHAAPVADLVLPKRDINQVGCAETLAALTGIPLDAARAVCAHGPYYQMSDVEALPEVDGSIFARIAAILAPPELSYLDKVTGRRIALEPDASEALARIDDAEDASPELPAGWTVCFEAHGNGYRVLSAPEAAPGGEAHAALRSKFGGANVVPRLVDAKGATRYLDPGYCGMQLDEGVPAERAREIVEAAGLEIYRMHRTAGLFTLRVPNGARDPGAVFRALEILNRASEVRIAEPCYLAFADDAEARPAVIVGTAVVPKEPAPPPSPPPAPPPDLPASDPPWNLALIGAPEAWGEGTGSDRVIVAVIDSGVDAGHPALAGAILAQDPAEDRDFTSEGSTSARDDEGHGTFIAGIVAGNGELGVRGVARGCRLLPVKIPMAGGPDCYARRRDAILFALDRVKPGERLVLNVSWKTNGDVAMIREALERAEAREVVVVASAGNGAQRENQPHFPSDYPTVVSVAAVGPDRRRSSYSFYGDEVDLSAPGGSGAGRASDDIRSAAPGGRTEIDCGTSFSAPHVAGVAALVLSHNLALRARDVRYLLAATAVKLAEPGMGHGLVDAKAAIEAAKTWTGPSPLER